MSDEGAEAMSSQEVKQAAERSKYYVVGFIRLEHRLVYHLHTPPSNHPSATNLFPHTLIIVVAGSHGSFLSAYSDTHIRRI